MTDIISLTRTHVSNVSGVMTERREAIECYFKIMYFPVIFDLSKCHSGKM